MKLLQKLLLFRDGEEPTEAVTRQQLDGVVISGGGAHTIKDEGTSLTARASLDFQGAGVTATDDAAGGKTVVTVPGGGGEVDGGTASSVYTMPQVIDGEGA